MSAKDICQKACENYREAGRTLRALVDTLCNSDHSSDREIGQALLQNPERVSLIGLPVESGVGVPFDAHMSPAATYDVSHWTPEKAREIAGAVMALAEMRLKCSSAYGRLSSAERLGMLSPRDIIDSVLR